MTAAFGQSSAHLSPETSRLRFESSPSNLPSVKSTLPVCCFLVVAVGSGFAQGVITFGNHLPTLQAPIFGPELDWEHSGGDWANAKSGNTPTNRPAGTQVYNGALLESMVVSFWAAPGVFTDGNLLLPGEVTTSLGTGALAGYFPTTTVTFAGIPHSSTVTLQVRVADPSGLWMFGGNQFPGFAAVSSLFTVNVDGLPVTATGLRSFSVGWFDNSTLTPYVPEPSAAALLLTSLAAFSRRWRKTLP